MREREREREKERQRERERERDRKRERCKRCRDAIRQNRQTSQNKLGSSMQP